MELIGDSSAAQFRYHTWRWTNAAGASVTTQRDGGGSFGSAVLFSAAGFDQRTDVQVALSACSRGYDAGSCRTATATVTVIPALPRPT